MEYLIFGMGGVGASVAERLVSQGSKVSAIARGEHLRALQQNGIRVTRTFGDETRVEGFSATTTEDYEGSPDVVFVCTKGYSLNSVYPFIERICTPDTVIIPLLNIYGTGQEIKAHLEKSMGDAAPLCTDGCIYVAAELTGPGILFEQSPLCRIFFGLPGGVHQPDILDDISKDASGTELQCILSSNIERDALKKFSYVSPMGATAIIHASDAGDIQSKEPVRATFIEGIREVVQIGERMGIDFGKDMVEANLAIADNLSPTSTTSMQRDLETGHQSEFDGLINEVLRLGEKYGVPTPTYLLAKKCAFERFGVQ